jgi:hypothetical protein
MPVARFYYQGSHSHPIRRTVLIVDETPTMLTGYELREGKTIRSYGDAVIRSYRKDRIAKFGDYSRLRKNRQNYNRNDSESTLTRAEMFDLVKNGA